MNKRNLEDILDKLNISVDNLGYLYLIGSVEIYIKSKTNNITQIYREIAEAYATKHSRVERAIRHEIDKNEDKIKQFFNVDYNITNRRFLALLAREMEREKC